MKNLFFTFLATMGAIGLFTGCTTKNDTAKVKHVIIIGIDGMSVGGAIKANTPTFDEIAKNGCYSYNSRNVFPTLSSSNWETMLTSASPAMTGVSSNDWRHDNFKLPPMRLTENGWFPDVFYVLKKADANLKTASVYHWSGFGNLYDKSNVDIDIDSKDEFSTTDDAVKVIKEEKPNFLFIQLDQVDHWGHTAGHMTPRYLEAVESADSLAGKIIDAVKEAGIYESTLVIITADHGGIGYGHGHESVEGNTVPYFFYGRKVKNTGELNLSITHFNLAPLTVYALGYQSPDVWLGSDLKSIFEGEEDPLILGKFMAPAVFVPEILPKATNGTSGGLYIDETPKVTIKSYSTDGDIYYTLDGSIPSKNSTKYTEPFELNKSCQVKASFISSTGKISPFTEAFFRVVSGENAGNKINYTLYKGEGWSKLPDFSREKKIATGTTAEFSLDELADKIKGYTGVVMSSYFDAMTNGKYTFYTRSDDGSKLFVDGKEVVNNDGDHGVKEENGSVDLTRGLHKIEVHYFNGGGGSLLTTLVEGPEINKQIISPEYLAKK